jgi:CDP-diacylglycerol--glycerol-3-phosphate 3-phosphatidyltransferase
MASRQSIKESGRKLLEPVARFLVGIGVHANWVTVGGFVLALISARYFAGGSVRIGGFFLLLAGLSDSIDGMIARMASSVKKFGAFLDSSLDRYSEGAVFFGLGVHYARGGSVLGVALVLIVLVGSFLISYVRARAEGLGEACTVGFMERPERMVVLIVCSLLGHTMLGVGLLILALLTHITALHRIYYVYKKMERPSE